MNVEDYKSFDELASTLHFGQTARKLGMSPSALTRRIQAIEDELGVQLLLRDQRSVALTPAGARFRAFARSQLQQWEELRLELRRETESPSGELHIACTVTACHTVLPRLLALSRQRYPNLTLRLITQDAERSRQQLEDGELDVAVIPFDAPAVSEPSPELEAVALGYTDLTFIVPSDPGAMRDALESEPPDFSKLPLVVPVGGLERRRLDAWLSERNIIPSIHAEVRGNEGIIAMVSLGSGVGLVPELVLGSSPLRDTVTRLERVEAPSGYEVALCARSRTLRRSAVRVFWELAREVGGRLTPSTG